MVVHLGIVLPGHEQVSKAYVDEDRTRLHEVLEARDLPPCYYNHRVVRENPNEEVWPFALYMDGVPYSQLDSVLGVWLVCVVTKKRFLVANVRKRSFCRCGCRGWCTFYGVFVFIKWMVVAMSESRWPMARHDGGEWRPSDVVRESKAGKDLGVRCAFIYIKGDWCEYSSTFGFPTWQDSIRPCFNCNAFRKGMFVVSGNSENGLVWASNEDGDYDRACRLCEVVVEIKTVNDKKEILERLRYDKSDKGGRGRTLTRDLPRFSLRTKDRLEPSSALPDVGEFENVKLPCSVVFWRISVETHARHRNPLFCEETAMSPTRSVTVDTLHALYRRGQTNFRIN